jgi:hypothetical protein
MRVVLEVCSCVPLAISHDLALTRHAVPRVQRAAARSCRDIRKRSAAPDKVQRSPSACGRPRSRRNALLPAEFMKRTYAFGDQTLVA